MTTLTHCARTLAHFENSSEPRATFDLAYAAIGMAATGRYARLDETVMRMDTAPREWLLDALQADNLLPPDEPPEDDEIITATIYAPEGHYAPCTVMVRRGDATTAFDTHGLPNRAAAVRWLADAYPDADVLTLRERAF